MWQLLRCQNDLTGDTVIMKIKGELVGILMEIDPNAHKNYIYYEKGVPVLHLEPLKASYGMLHSSSLFYRKFVKDLKSYGFELNPYDPCVANKMVDGKQLTIYWHVDDLKASHEDSKVIDGFVQWIKDKYEDEEITKVRVTCGKKHNYLGCWR